MGTSVSVILKRVPSRPNVHFVMTVVASATYRHDTLRRSLHAFARWSVTILRLFVPVALALVALATLEIRYELEDFGSERF